MKKTTIIRSLSVFVLSLCVAACNESEQDILDSSLETDIDENNTSSSSNNQDEEEERMDIEDVTDLFSLLDYIDDWNNYTMTIEYYEIFSDDYEDTNAAKQAYQDGTMELQYLDYFVTIIRTEDAVLYKYYLDKENYLNDEIDDLELFVNDYDGENTNVYYPNESGDGLYYAGRYTNGIWEDTFTLYNLPYLSNFKRGITQGDTIEGENGKETEYTFNTSLSGLTEVLVDTLFDGYNMFSTQEYVYGPYNVISLHNLGSDSYYDVSFTYYDDLFNIDANIKTHAIYWTGKPNSSYTYTVSWLEQDEMTTSLYDVGTSAISSDYSAYL